MSYARVFAAQTLMLEPHIITVEVDLSRGLHNFTIVGLPDKAVEEARDRVGAAIKHAGFTSPKNKNQKVVVSLAPAELKKTGPMYDLAIAVGYLKAAGEIEFDERDKLFLGELSLKGEVRPVQGVLPLVREAQKIGFKEVYVPKENAAEAALVEGIAVYPVENLEELVSHIAQNEIEGKIKANISVATPTSIEKNTTATRGLEDIRGQESAKRALVIAAAGGHNIALYGPPGTGKTMLAKTLPQLLPDLSFEEALEVTSIHSAAGALTEVIISKPPYRAPHHTASYVSLVGGGAIPKPGELTLAHRGVLFMDEFPEFEKRVIESLRQPLEEGVVSIARASSSVTFPANVILVAAMNPCPCGKGGEKCQCTPQQLERYRKKLSGPIMDRIDLWIELPHVEYEVLSAPVVGERLETKNAVESIARAREQQYNRFQSSELNANMTPKHIEEHASLSDELTDMFNTAARTLELSPRAYHRVLKVARTIADLDNSKGIAEEHLLEALQYRKTL